MLDLLTRTTMAGLFHRERVGDGFLWRHSLPKRMGADRRVFNIE
jgi:hypothetical protein